MDSLLFNKIAAGVLIALLLVFGIGKIGNTLYGPDEVAHDGAVMEAGGEEMAADESAGAAPAEPGMSLAALLNAADLAAGEAASRKCASCHTFDKGGADRVGPNQWGVVGGPTAHKEGYAYSSAMASLGGTWTFEALDAYLLNPKAAVPGTKMTFAGLPRPEERANLLAWMNQQSDAPIALPEPPAEEPATEEAVEQTEDAAAATGDDAPAEDTGEAATTEGGDEAAAGGDSLYALIAAADPDAGQGVSRKCASCHTFDEGGANRVGPNLWGVVGNPVASHDGFNYSSAMESFGGEWTYQRLWDYMHDPRGVVPGTKMAFVGIKNDTELANLLAWMRLQDSDPLPLAGDQ